MITDRELDAQLAGAAGVRDTDLPALPEEFLRLLTAAAAQSEPASILAARQLVSDAREARTATGSRRRRPSRKAVLRAGLAVIAVAAAWTTAVLVAPSDGTGRPSDGTGTPSEHIGTSGISLVAAEEITFPLSLDPQPAGLTPYFSRVGGAPPFEEQPLVYTADYSSPDGDRVLVNLFPKDPRGLAESGWSVEGDPAGSATVDGTQAKVRRGDGFTDILWERPDGRWVRILGEGAYAEIAAVVTVAESLVDRPQPLGLQFGLAPAGWSLTGYEESRSIDLTRDDDPQQLLRLSVYPPGGNGSIDTMLKGMDLAGPVTPVTIQGQEGRLALAKGDQGHPDYWYTVGQLPNGSRFLLLAPRVLTQEQVLEIAEQVTYTP